MSSSIILIIDDEEIVRLSIEALLYGEGYELHFASSGSEGLQKALQLQPDVILLDIMMPGMDGYEVCQQIRNNAHLAEIAIIMITAMGDWETKLQGLGAGADDFLPKPIDRLELRARLRTITRLDRYRKLGQERNKLEHALHDLRLAYDETIEGWTRAVDLRDKETEGHSQRVKEYTETLARLMGIDGEQITYMRWGALLHDIGKLAIPDAILLKPASLTEEENRLMKKHPQYALEMLSPIAYLRPILDIPYCHHERWNGKGYPRGLKGEEIPFAARIFTIIDVWDALTSARPYRPAWERDTAIRYICNESGTYFDPQVVEAFLRSGLVERKS